MLDRSEITDETEHLCERFGIRRLGLFGSVARGEDSAGSDLDFFAEFDDPSPETMPQRYFGFIEEATKRFNRPVQLLTPRMIRNPFLQQSIDRDLVILHG
jgi:predicted nucleotidyltransferase